MPNQTAPEGQIFVCGACGKTSRDLYGYSEHSPGWDESCMLNAVLCFENSLSKDRHGYVIGAEAARSD